MTDPAAAASPAQAASDEQELRAHVERALAASYVLEHEMGRGGMGIVYRARDRRLKRPVAVKILPPELAFRSEIRSRFLREAETAAQLSHPNIVPIYSVDEADGIVYFVMACVDGENLGKRLHDRGALPVDEARRILSEVADALAYAHARGVVHRDIKPDNILLDRDSDRALVTDFGIARAIIEGSDARLTATGMAIGTPAYMSPEQAAGDREIDGRSDLYALGVLGYQMLAGELPFKASSTPALLIKHLSERPVPIEQRRPDTPADLAAAVMRLLEKEPAQRFATAGELEAALRGRSRPVAPASFATTQPPVAAPVASLVSPVMSPAAAPAAGPLPPMPVPPAPRVPPPVAPAPVTADLDPAAPTANELAQWEAPRVVKFRRWLGWFAIIGPVLLVASIVGNSEFYGFVGLWAVFIAFRYAKLWSEGYDWHDVLRQPRDRLFADVASEWGEGVEALFDPKKRDRVRERARRDRLRAAAAPRATRPSDYAPSDSGAVRASDATYGAYAAGAWPGAARGAPAPGIAPGLVAAAMTDRDEIQRLLKGMSGAERANVGGAGPAAQQLADRIQELAGRVAAFDRDATPGAVDVLETEIARLEGEANPLDRAASDERVRRLAYLKRQRRAVTEHARRREAAAGALEDCRLALQNMRLDLVRLQAGAGSPAQVTVLAARAMALAREVDGIVGAAGEVARGDLPAAPPLTPTLGATGNTPARA